MTKFQRILWASSASILILSLTFKPTPVYATETLESFDELYEWLMTPGNVQLQTPDFDDAEVLYIFSNILTMQYLFGITPSDQAVSLGSATTIQGHFILDGVHYPAVLTLSQCSLAYGQKAQIYSCPFFTYHIVNDQSSLTSVVTPVLPDTTVSYSFGNFEFTNSTYLSMQCSDTSYGNSLSVFRSLRGFYKITTGVVNLPSSSTPYQFVYSSVAYINHPLLSLAGSANLADVSFSPATITQDYVDKVYPLLKQSAPNIDSIIPIVSDVPLPDYDDFVYPPDFPIPELPEIELPTNDIPANALQGASFWFSAFTNFVDGLDVGWIVVILIAVAFLFHVVFKF